jgi:hypothetical protein
MRGVPALALLGLVSVNAVAQPAQRTFVSTGGVDTNPCSRSSPCRNFAAAVTAVAGGGEVVVLDSGGYGAVSITKSVSLISPGGVYAGTTGFSGSAISINVSGGSVVLRGLSINGLGATDGIAIVMASTVHIENLVASGFAGNAVHVQAGSFTVRDSEIRDNAEGIFIDDLTGSVNGSIDHTRLENNSLRGVEVNAGQAALRDCFFFHGDRAIVVGSSTGLAEVTLIGCMISGSNYGVEATAGMSAFAEVHVSGNTFDHTTYPMLRTGFTASNYFQSFGNNTFTGNLAGVAMDATLSLQ